MPEKQPNRVTLADAFGRQATYGARWWWGRVGNRTAFIQLLGKGEMDGVDKAYYQSGYDLPEAGNWKFWSSDDGVETGPPTLIPGLPDFKPKGKTWVECLLPADISGDGTEEPGQVLWFLRCLKVHDYTLDGSDNLVQGAKIFSANNALVNLFIGTQRMKLPLSRFHGPSWMEFKERCAETITYAGGSGLQGVYFSDTALTTPVLTRNDPYVDFTFDSVAPSPVVPITDYSVRFSGQVRPEFSETYTFYAESDGGVRLWVNGVQIINDWTDGEVRERTSATIALTANALYDITLEYYHEAGQSRVALSWSSASRAKQLVPQSRLVPPARNVERFNAHVAFPQPVPALTAFESVFRRAPGCDWQDVNGKIKVLTTPERAVAHKLTYDLTQTALAPNVTDNSFSETPLPKTSRPNFISATYFDLDDPFFTERTVEWDARPDTSEPLRPLGPFPLGVMHRSLAQRIIRCELRVARELNQTVRVTSFVDSYRAAKGDAVEMSHEVADWRETAPQKLLVTEERFLFGPQAADDRALVLRRHSDAYYSDADHGDLDTRLVSAPASPFSAPGPPQAQAAEVSATAVTVRWLPPAANFEGVTHYLLTVGTGLSGGAVTGALTGLDGVRVEALSYSFPAPDVGTYHFGVSAHNPYGASAQATDDFTVEALEVNTIGITDHVIIDEVSAPATPPAGRVALYAKSDGQIYKKDDTGVEAPLGGDTLPVVDTTALVKGSADDTKRLRFEVDGFSAGQTRVLTPPNYDGTIATLAGTETLTNKTLTSPVINSPTGIVKGDVGLGNVDNTSDANKPVSTATQTALDAKQPLDATLTALATHNTNGLLTQTAADTFAGRTITGTANQVTVTNGDGVSGNPTLSLPQSIHTGAAPTFSSLTLGGASGNTLVVDTSTLVVDATNNRVGVGTASPSYPVHVAHATFAQLYLSGGTAADILLFHSGAAANAKWVGLRSQAGKGKISSFTDAAAYQQEFIIGWDNLAGNVGIGTGSPNAAAQLEITSTTRGVLLPRMTTTQRDAISSPPDGLVIYNTTTNKFQGRAAGAWADLN